MLYRGIIIESHCIKDARSKEAAGKSLTGWQQKEQSVEDWMHELEAGKTIVLAEMESTPEGIFTHGSDNFIRTFFIFADADNFKDANNPDGIEPWAHDTGLSEMYPDLKDRAYAVGQSVSSMLKEPKHRRYRIIFKFDEAIETPEHYKQVLSKVSKEYPIITQAKRQPAQPVFGNAREGYNKFAICGNILKLADYPYEPPPSPLHKGGSGGYVDNRTSSQLDMKVLDYIDCSNYDDWLMVGMALFNEGEPCSVWDYWSSRSEKYDPGACEKKWATFGKSGTEVKWGTLMKMAKERGYETPQHYVSEPPPLESEIDTDTSEQDIPKFPDELWVGIFKQMKDAYKDEIPIPDAFLFAGLKHAVSAILGKSIWIASGNWIYPNTYTALIGESAKAHKTVLINEIKKILNQADESVQTLRTLSTKEGLVNLWVEPVLDDESGLYKGGYAGLVQQVLIEQIKSDKVDRENVRWTGMFPELGEVLLKNKQPHGSGLIELLLDLIDNPPELESPTKTNPTIAYNPTWTMLGASTFELIEKSLERVYITSGFSNRMEWYVGESKPPKFIYGTANEALYQNIIAELSEVRRRWGLTRFTWDPSLLDACQTWLENFEEALDAEQNLLIKNSLTRMKMHLIKNALIFAVLENEDNVVLHSQFDRAVILAEYLTKCVKYLFADFVSTETYKVENRIVEILKKKPHQSTAEIWGQMRWASRQDVHISITRMVESQILGANTPKKTVKYYVRKEEF